MVFTIEELKEYDNTGTGLDGKYVPLRPCNWKYESIWVRLCDAWDVLLGRVDIVVWPETWHQR